MMRNPPLSCLINMIAILIFVVSIIADRVSKYFVLNYLKPVENLEIIKDILNFTYLENYGAAFGVFQDGRIFFIVFTVIMIIALILFMKKENSKIIDWSVMMIIGGGTGNLLDRVIHGHVIDFISLSVFPPIFNLADCFITIGSVILIVHVLFFKQEGRTQITYDKE